MTEEKNDLPNDASERLAASMERLEPALTTLLTTVARERRSAGVWSLFKRGGLVTIFLLGLVVWAFIYGTAFGVRPQLIKPTVAQIEITGEIGGDHPASADLLVPMLQGLCKQPQVKALVLHISSPGGSPGDAERIGATIDDCKVISPDFENRKVLGGKRPVIAVIDGLGASAAYMIALHADRIVVNPTGMVGSIGVIIEGMKYDGLLNKVGVTSYAYTSGPLKSMLSPYAEDSPEQKVVAQELINDAMTVFQTDVKTHRPHLKLDTPDLWSGRVWVGQQAKDIGLVDSVDLLESVEATEFPNWQVQPFRPTRDVKSFFSLSSWVSAIHSEFASNSVHME